MSENDPTNIWTWIHKDADRLEQEGGRKVAILQGWSDFWDAYHSNHAAADLAITGALEVAREQREVRWELLLRHWRLQLWLKDDLRRALPEAVDLLSLATDERVRDVPQRICAYHDVVDCHVGMDAGGYYEDIVANSHDVLAQLPARHTCADCARLNMVSAAADSGRAEEAETWMARFAANQYDPKYTSGPVVCGEAYEALGKWEAAEQSFTRARDLAREQEDGDHYLKALLGIARARAARGDAQGAASILRDARHTAKYTGGTYLVARQLGVEGYVAEAVEEPAVALDYFTRSARQYVELARYREAALTSLHAVEMAREHELPDAEAALTIAAQAVGNMPPASRDVYARLAALGRQPAPLATGRQGGGPVGLVAGAGEMRSEADGERAALQEMLAAHLASGNLRGVALALYRLGRWHASHEESRAAVDYLIANAILERVLELPMDDREDALGGLQHLSKQLPPGTVQAALTAAESGPSPMLAPLLGEMPPARWQWLVRSVATEVAGQPVVEPEPAEQDGNGFSAWIEHVATMSALIVRFRERAAPAKCEQWATSLDETAQEIAPQVGPNGEGREVITLANGLAALARGQTVEEVAVTVLPPFNELIEQIGEIAQRPVWHHPGSSPLDFLVEQAAQRAVRGLRVHDEHRTTRLRNLVFRFELMMLDLRQHEQLHPIAQFLDALSQLLLADGERMPTIDPPLAEPFGAVLASVYEAGKAAMPASGESHSQG